MFKKHNFTSEIEKEFEQMLVKRAYQNKDKNFIKYEEAVEFLHRAAEIFEEVGAVKEAEFAIQVIEKIASKSLDDSGIAALHALRQNKNLEFTERKYAFEQLVNSGVATSAIVNGRVVYSVKQNKSSDDEVELPFYNKK